MKQSEFKRRYDVKMGRYVKKHIYGEGISDVFKMTGRKVFGKMAKDAAQTATKKLLRLLLPRMVNMLAKEQAIKLFSY